LKEAAGEHKRGDRLQRPGFWPKDWDPVYSVGNSHVELDAEKFKPLNSGTGTDFLIVILLDNEFSRKTFCLLGWKNIRFESVQELASDCGFGVESP